MRWSTDDVLYVYTSLFYLFLLDYCVYNTPLFMLSLPSHLFNPFSSYFYSCKYGIYYSTPLYFSSITDKHSLFIRFAISDGVNLFLHFRKTKSVQIFELFNFFFHGKIKFENEKRALSIKKNNLNNQ